MLGCWVISLRPTSVLPRYSVSPRRSGTWMDRTTKRKTVLCHFITHLGYYGILSAWSFYQIDQALKTSYLLTDCLRLLSKRFLLCVPQQPGASHLLLHSGRLHHSEDYGVDSCRTSEEFWLVHRTLSWAPTGPQKCQQGSSWSVERQLGSGWSANDVIRVPTGPTNVSQVRLVRKNASRVPVGLNNSSDIKIHTWICLGDVPFIQYK